MAVQNNSIGFYDEEFESDEEEIAAAAFLVFASCHLLTKEDNENKIKKRKPRRMWVKKWLEKRQSDGAYIKLLAELRYGNDRDDTLFRNFLRMSSANFDELLAMVEPLIQKRDTNFHMAISAAERLTITLHYLATGNSFNSLQYLFRIPQCTISTIIPEVLDAIWTVLKDKYIRVSLFSPNFINIIIIYYLLNIIYIEYCVKQFYIKFADTNIGRGVDERIQNI